MFLGHDLGRVLNSYHEAAQRFGNAQSIQDVAEDQSEELSPCALFVQLAIVIGLMVGNIVMLALFVGAFAHHY